MLKKRLIPKFLLRDGRLVKYVRFFENERAAGNPVTTAKVYNDYGVDELIVLDIVPSEASRHRVVEIIERMSEEIFMPFTVGGGVKTLDDVNMLLRAGADKVSRVLSVPLIVSGGCGSLQHAIDALEAGASAVAISSMFLFTDHSPIKLRSHLFSRGLDVRASSSSRN